MKTKRHTEVKFRIFYCQNQSPGIFLVPKRKDGMATLERASGGFSIGVGGVKAARWAVDPQDRVRFLANPLKGGRNETRRTSSQFRISERA